MVQEYKKIGVTTDGYRGERAILKERVIEGLEKSQFADASLQLDVNSPQTIYLTNNNFAEGYYILLPNAATLWENWQVRIINDSGHDCNVYYYTSNLSQLNLFKEVTAGNMLTCILLDNAQGSDQTGTWTNLRTTESSSADRLYRYTSDTLDTLNITWNELLQETTQVSISLGTLLAGTSLKSIYVKTTEAFDGVNTLTLDIGTEDDPDYFISGYDLKASVTDNNFTKDLFEEILSTSSPTTIYATITGSSNLTDLIAGSVSITLEKPKLIDPTVLKNPIVQTQVPIGVIMSYCFNDIPEGYWRLDGTMIPNAASAIPEFVQKLILVNNSLSGEKLIVSETVWNQLNNTYGSCGKFCWVGGNLKFPKINNFIQGLTDLTKLALLTPAGLPDPNLNHIHVNGNYNWGSNNGWFSTRAYGTTANMPSGGGVTGWNGSGNGGSHSGAGVITGNQITSLPVNVGGGQSGVFGRSNTVQPESIRYPYIISIYNKIQNAATLDLDEIIQDSIYKANTNLDNLTDDGINVIENIINQNKSSFFTNYNNGIAISIPYAGYGAWTASSNGFLGINLAGSYINGYRLFNGNGVLIWRAGDDINANSKWVGTIIPVKVGTQLYYDDNNTYAFETISTIFYAI